MNYITPVVFSLQRVSQVHQKNCSLVIFLAISHIFNVFRNEFDIRVVGIISYYPTMENGI